MRKICRGIIAGILALTMVLINPFVIDAEESADLQVSAEYSMIMDAVSGANIETFVIERPDPEALKNNVVNASVFGLSVTNEDNYKAFSDAITYCQDNPNTYLVIDKGVYYFTTNATITLSGLKNVLIEGNGAEFIFENQKQFAITECDGVELRNLVIDWNWAKDRVASLVQVQNKTDNSFDIKFLELDDVDVDIPLVSFQQYDSKEYIPGSYGSYKTFAPAEVPGSIVNVEKVEANVLRVYFSSKFTTHFHNEEVYSLRHYTYGGEVFGVGGGSSNITFDNVRIYGNAGMGYVIGDKANHFQIINSYIGLRPGNEDRQRLSTSADGIHILNSGGFFRIDNCDFSFTGDDIINIHDDMFKVTQVDSSNRLIGEVTGGFVHKGDKIRIYNSNLEDIGFESEVTSFIRQTDSATLTLQDDLPSDVTDGYYVYRSSTRTHNYVISNNYIHETKGRAALMNAADALFENNRLYRTKSECLQVRVDLADRSDKTWYEGSGAHNVVINNNTFEECAFGGSDSIITIDCNVGTKKDVLYDIHITNNKFYNCYGELVVADNVSDLYIENNIISDCGDIKSTENCGNIYITDNIISHPSESCQHEYTMQIHSRHAGCFEYGSTGETYCTQCRTIINDDYIGLSPLEHKGMLVKRIDVYPTCIEDGLSSNVCSMCGTVVDTGITEPATGHNFVEVITNTSNAESKSHKCTGCGIIEEHDSTGTNGTCSVCGHGKSVEVGFMSLELDAANVDYIGINLYIDAPNGTEFYVDGVRYEPAGSKENGLYKIQYKCAPKELADRHILRVKDSTNKAININNKSEYSYSGDMYCRYILSTENEYSDELKNVCSSLIDYSEQAMNYFGYNNAGLTIGDIAARVPTSGHSMKITGELPNCCEYLGSSLVLGDEVILRHYFTGDANRFVISCTDVTLRKSTSVAISSVDAINGFYVDIKVPYSYVGNMYEVKLKTAGTGTSYTLRYGVVTYCNYANGLNTNNNLINLCKALYYFSSAILEYKKSA